ncbi:hypothetical protein AX14_002693 [Amanita brunnescens Koide BX004]|nr:hypothetical protein AX14_002693 [Amanita brunnescens Koide BX004]
MLWPIRSRSAEKPFGRTAKADVVLRSKGPVDFFVLKDLVRAASDSSSSPDTMGLAIGETANGQTIISVAEHSEVLHHLLSLIYRVSDELDIQNSWLYIQVVLAARRYEMTTIETQLRKQVAASPLISTEPLRIYIVASALGWAELAKSAAINTLSSPLENMTHMTEFDLITGADLYRLVSFRFRCVDAALNVINGNSDYETYGPGGWALLPESGDAKNGNPKFKGHGRIWEFSDRKFCHYGPAPGGTLLEKLRSCPRGSAVKDVCDLEDTVLWAASRLKPCVTVDAFIVYKILKCRREIEEAVEAAVAKVSLDLAV